MSPSLFLPEAHLIRLDLVVPSLDTLTLVVSTVQAAPPCPDCGQLASRVHSAYVRLPADLPCCGVPVRLELHTRRFYCDRPECARRIFTERLPGLVQPYARHTTRLTDTLAAVAYALGGEAGARLASRLAISTSPDTLLRRLAQSAPPADVTPRVLGVDDWALRKGQRYGTILVDLERHCVVDLLPDRRAETLAEWLKARPGVEIIARDRGGAYADGARQGAPDALQVADRWHLLKNLVEALEAALAREQRAFQQAMGSPSGPTPSDAATAEALPPADPPVEAPEPRPRQTRAQRESAERCERRRAVFEEVRRLYGEGYSLRAIAEKTGKDRRTVRQYLQADSFPEPKKRQRRPGQLAPFQPYLEQRWREGCHNAAQLWREIREQGFGGGCSAVKQRLSGWRAKLPPEERQTSGKPSQHRSATRAPAPRAVVWWLLGLREQLTAEQTEFLDRLKTASPTIVMAQELVLEFFALAKRREAGALGDWMKRVAASGIEELRGFCAGLCRDWEAVVAGLTLEWSSGPVEGQVNRLKFIKRQMFGRAGFPLLRVRVLPTAMVA